MRKVEAVSQSGQVVVELIPETEEDVLEIRRLARAGEIDDREQINDSLPRPKKSRA